jgi:ATP phosphoribosyltransferase regulatory subunit HisZ
VRGLDYYSRTVFEWITTDLGSQDAVCSGGRYDGLVAQLGGEATPAVGWALGQERVVELIRQQGVVVDADALHAYLVLAGAAAESAGLVLAEQWRKRRAGPAGRNELRWRRHQDPDEAGRSQRRARRAARGRRRARTRHGRNQGPAAAGTRRERCRLRRSRASCVMSSARDRTRTDSLAAEAGTQTE